MAITSLGLNNNNSDGGLKSIGALISLFDPSAGRPVAIMDVDWITAYRTATLRALAACFSAPKIFNPWHLQAAAFKLLVIGMVFLAFIS